MLSAAQSGMSYVGACWKRGNLNPIANAAKAVRGTRNYPDVLPPHILQRQRKVGFDLYGLLGIGKEDRQSRAGGLPAAISSFSARQSE